MTDPMIGACQEIDKLDAEVVALRADLKAVAVAARYLMEVREIKCHHDHPPPDYACAKCRMDAALARPGVQEALKDD